MTKDRITKLKKKLAQVDGWGSDYLISKSTFFQRRLN